VGYDFNHQSSYTKRFLDRVNRYWLREFHTDGYRFDLTKGYTQTYSGNDVGLWQQYDAARVAILERMVDSIWAFDPTAIVVFEHLSDNPEQTELSNHGILLWGNMNNEYNQNTMGYNSSNDISWVSYQARGWSNANLVGYMESHDEERLMYKNELYGDSIGGYNAKSLDTALERMECAGALFFPVPGPKMLWQFGERAMMSLSISSAVSAPNLCTGEYMRNAHRVAPVQKYGQLR
jgi:1,4-alpha-glucan branching enzyme